MGEKLAAEFTAGTSGSCWYAATVAAVNADGTYTVDWYDGGAKDRIKRRDQLKRVDIKPRADPKVAALASEPTTKPTKAASDPTGLSTQKTLVFGDAARESDESSDEDDAYEDQDVEAASPRSHAKQSVAKTPSYRNHTTSTTNDAPGNFI